MHTYIHTYIHLAGPQGVTALMKYAKDCNSEGVRILLDAGAHVGDKDMFGRTAADLVQLWVQQRVVKGADVNELFESMYILRLLKVCVCVCVCACVYTCMCVWDARS
jgi:hypothetical protein